MNKKQVFAELSDMDFGDFIDSKLDKSNLLYGDELEPCLFGLLKAIKKEKKEKKSIIDVVKKIVWNEVYEICTNAEIRVFPDGHAKITPYKNFCGEIRMNNNPVIYKESELAPEDYLD